MTNDDLYKDYMQKLKLDRTSVQINSEEFGMTTAIIRVENLNRAGAKFTTQRN
jgi:hypothetical protein